VQASACHNILHQAQSSTFSHVPEQACPGYLLCYMTVGYGSLWLLRWKQQGSKQLHDGAVMTVAASSKAHVSLP